MHLTSETAGSGKRESVLELAVYEDCVKALSFRHEVCLLGNEEMRGS